MRSYPLFPIQILHTERRMFLSATLMTSGPFRLGPWGLVPQCSSCKVLHCVHQIDADCGWSAVTKQGGFSELRRWKQQPTVAETTQWGRIKTVKLWPHGVTMSWNSLSSLIKLSGAAASDDKLSERSSLSVITFLSTVSTSLISSTTVGLNDKKICSLLKHNLPSLSSINTS